MSKQGVRVIAAMLPWVLACGGGDELPPAPPPPAGVVPEPPATPTPPVPTPEPPAPAGSLLAGRWGELGLGAGDAGVRAATDAQALLMFKGTEARDSTMLFMDWELALANAGYKSVATWTEEGKAGAVWAKDAVRIGIARGVLEGEGYLYAEDESKVAKAAVAERRVEEAVRRVLDPASPAAKAPSADLGAREGRKLGPQTLTRPATTVRPGKEGREGKAPRDGKSIKPKDK